MIEKTEYVDVFKPAMQLTFGRTLICRNQDTCSQYSKSHDMDTITLEGKWSPSSSQKREMVNEALFPYFDGGRNNRVNGGSTWEQKPSNQGC